MPTDPQVVWRLVSEIGLDPGLASGWYQVGDISDWGSALDQWMIGRK
jgi:hypothetical protein